MNFSDTSFGQLGHAETASDFGHVQFPQAVPNPYDSAIDMSSSSIDQGYANPNSQTLSHSLNSNTQRKLESGARDVELVWYQTLFSFFIINESLSLDLKQLQLLGNLTNASQQALTEWFNTHVSSATFQKVCGHQNGATSPKPWDNFLYSFYVASERRMPDDAELFYLYGLTGLPEDHLRGWFGHQRQLNTAVRPAPVFREIADANILMAGTSAGQSNLRNVNAEHVQLAGDVATQSPSWIHHELPQETSEHSLLDQSVGVISRNNAPAPATRLRGINVSPQHNTELFRLVLTDVKRRELQCTCGRYEKGGGKHSCLVGCGKKYKTRFERNKHQDVRFPQDYWFCTICGDVESPRSICLFARKDKFRSHIKRHSKNAGQWTTNDANFRLNIVNMSQPCDLCHEDVHILKMQKHVIGHVEKGYSMDNWRTDNSEQRSSNHRKRRKGQDFGHDTGDDDDDSNDDDSDHQDDGHDKGSKDGDNCKEDGDPPFSNPRDHEDRDGYGRDAAEAPFDFDFSFVNSWETSINRQSVTQEKLGRLKAALQASAVETFDGRYFIPYADVKKCVQRIDWGMFVDLSSAASAKNICILTALLLIGDQEALRILDQGVEDDELSLARKEASRHPLDSEYLWWPSFYDVQWNFCPATLKDSRHARWPQDIILPFLEHHELSRKGTFSDVHLVVAHHSFLSHNARDYIQKTSGALHPDDNKLSTFPIAIKSMKGPSAIARELYNQENKALTVFHGVPGIVQSFGAFTLYDAELQDRSYNIVLEHAPLGDLSDYFAKNDPPTETKDIRAFWKPFLDLATALDILHGEKDWKSCYHMDIKPQNILCFGEIPGKGDFELKLADFGFSQVLVHDGAESAEQPWVSGGTALYRSPEYWSRNSSARTTAGCQAQDVWSLGCVMLEAATWLLSGVDGVEHIRRIRSEFIQHLSNVEDDDSEWFSLGKPEKLMYETVMWLSALQDCFRGLEPLTEEILTILEKVLVIQDWKVRSTAHEFSSRLRHVFDHLAVAHGKHCARPNDEAFLKHLDIHGTFKWRRATRPNSLHLSAGHDEGQRPGGTLNPMTVACPSPMHRVSDVMTSVSRSWKPFTVYSVFGYRHSATEIPIDERVRDQTQYDVLLPRSSSGKSHSQPRRQFVLVDTPGFMDDFACGSDTEFLMMLEPILTPEQRHGRRRVRLTWPADWSWTCSEALRHLKSSGCPIIQIDEDIDKDSSSRRRRLYPGLYGHYGDAANIGDVFLVTDCGGGTADLDIFRVTGEYLGVPSLQHLSVVRWNTVKSAREPAIYLLCYGVKLPGRAEAVAAMQRVPHMACSTGGIASRLWFSKGVRAKEAFVGSLDVLSDVLMRSGACHGETDDGILDWDVYLVNE